MIDSTLMLTILPCERVAPYGIILYISHLPIFFADEATLQNKLFNSEARQSAASIYSYIFLKLLVLERQTVLY